MALDYDKVDVSTGLNSATRLNAELDKIHDALTDGLSRSGNGPNAMSADLDMGNNDILNAGAVQCDSILVDGQTIASVAALAAEADRAEVAAAEAEAAQVAAELAAASVSLPLISGGDAGKAILVNGAEDGYEYSAIADPATAIAAAITDQVTAEAGADNTELMTPLRTAQAVAAQILAGDYRATDSDEGTVLASTDASSASVGFVSVGGVDDYTAVTVAALTKLFSDIVKTNSIRLGSRLIQWGYVARTGPTTTVYFTTTFTSTPVVFLTPVDTALGDRFSINTVGVNNCTIRSNTTQGFYWLAIGTKTGAL